jgi:hypothetical protein
VLFDVEQTMSRPTWSIRTPGAVSLQYRGGRALNSSYFP